MALKVYGRPLSPFVQIAFIALSEKGVALDELEVDAGDQKTPEYLANINPFGKHPALEIDGFILYESRAVARYVLTKYESEGPNLLGSTAKERAMVDQWVEVEGHSLQPPMLQILVETFFAPTFMNKPTNPVIVEENLVKLEKVLDVYEAHLSKSKYLAGDFYSMADMLHLPEIQYFMTVTGKQSVITSRKHLNAWWEDISSRPAWKKVLEKYSPK